MMKKSLIFCMTWAAGMTLAAAGVVKAVAAAEFIRSEDMYLVRELEADTGADARGVMQKAVSGTAGREVRYGAVTAAGTAGAAVRGAGSAENVAGGAEEIYYAPVRHETVTAVGTKSVAGAASSAVGTAGAASGGESVAGGAVVAGAAENAAVSAENAAGGYVYQEKNPEDMRVSPDTPRSLAYPLAAERAEAEEQRHVWYDRRLHAATGHSAATNEALENQKRAFREAVNHCEDDRRMRLDIESQMITFANAYDGTAWLVSTFEETGRCYEEIGYEIVDAFYAGDADVRAAYEKKLEELFLSSSGVDFDPKFCGENCSLKALAAAQMARYDDFRAYLGELIYKATDGDGESEVKTARRAYVKPNGNYVDENGQEYILMTGDRPAFVDENGRKYVLQSPRGNGAN